MEQQPDPTLRPEPQVDDADKALRPQVLSEFIGQAEARQNLKVFIESARRRGVAMDHTLFHGPPGLGKTTLAQIIARELGVNFRMTSGPVLAKAGDLAAILTCTPAVSPVVSRKCPATRIRDRRLFRIVGSQGRPVSNSISHTDMINYHTAHF